jgi:formamidopyrimidine-DNA glycosylase
MPELPEVEVTRMSFADAIRGAQISGVRLGQPLRWPLGVAPQVLVGQQVLAVRRRGKYLLLDLSGGLLLLHLGMSGSLAFRAAPGAPGKHDHFDLVTSQGVLRLHDPRRFGAAVFALGEADPVARKLLGHLGVEPLGDDFEAESFVQAMKRRGTAIKSVLLAGEVVVGVGNIYASEALFLAGIRPTCRANALSRPRLLRLRLAIREVLARAVALGGSTLRNFSNAQGESGHFQQQSMVYGRAGELCRQCDSVVKTIRQGQRSTFFCPTCQKL